MGRWRAAAVWRLRLCRCLGRPLFTESDDIVLELIESNQSFDFRHFNNIYHENDPLENPYSEINLDSNFYDQPSFCKKFQNTDNLLFLSINIQSLPSKHQKLCALINLYLTNNLSIGVIALQEIWQIPYPETVNIPGFKFIYKTRAFSRGGGIGFYINENLNYKIVDELSPFYEKSFESLTIELLQNGKKTYISNIYRSPNLNIEIMQDFNSKLDNLLRNLQITGHKSIIFLDSNINLLNISNTNSSIDYLDTLLNNGFLQVNMKASRFQNQSSSLIDHILCNDTLSSKITSGVIIDDISDHFLTFLKIDYLKKSTPPQSVESRSFSSRNILNFKNSLNGLSWTSTTQSIDVNDSYENFINDFMLLFELHFPKTKKRFNKNFHKINDFMTLGLLTSRRIKNELHKRAINDPSLANCSKFKTYRNLFNTLIRKSKILYFESNLNIHEKNPKKTWDILREAIGKKSNSSITELNVNGNLCNDPIKIANEFNSFFSGIGQKISERVVPTEKDPLSYIPFNPDTPQLELGETGAIQVFNTLKLMDKKKQPRPGWHQSLSPEGDCV